MKKKTGKKLGIGLGVTAGLCALANFGCNTAIRRVNPIKKKKPETREMYLKRAELRKQNNQNLYDLKPEDLTLKSVNGLTMKAWYLPAEKETNRFVICVHGHRSNGPDEMSHLMPFYHYDLGYNYLLPDLTAHGRSEGKYIGFGSFDAKNILLWIDYLLNRFGEDIEIILHGISMGASTVLNCNEMSPPDQVKLIIEDCGFTNAEEVIGNTVKEIVGFKTPHLIKLFSLASKIKAGYFFSESDPLSNIDKSKNPILFIHGEEDTYVPFEYGVRLYEACPVPKDYLWVPDTPHAFSYYNAKEEYEQKIKNFIAEHMDKNSDTASA